MNKLWLLSSQMALSMSSSHIKICALQCANEWQIEKTDDKLIKISGQSSAYKD